MTSDLKSDIVRPILAIPFGIDWLRQRTVASDLH